MATNLSSLSLIGSVLRNCITMGRLRLPNIKWSLSVDWGVLQFQQNLILTSRSNQKRTNSPSFMTELMMINVPSGTDNDGGDQSTNG